MGEYSEETMEYVTERIVTDFMNYILKAEELTDLYFDNLKVDAELKDGRKLTISLKV